MLETSSINSPPVLVGKSESMQRMLRLMQKASANRYPILILGEYGTGKGAVARWIHANGPWRNAPFISLECAALEPDVVSDLFYTTGKNTSHTKRRIPATFEGATLFWDEVAELSLQLQSRLARAIPDEEFRATDSTRPAFFDARFVASMSHDPFVAIREGKFSEDLFFRLNVVSITLPPLRARKADIPLLAEHILHEIFLASGKASVRWRLSPDAINYLLLYEWPGNIRELRNCLRGATTLSSGPVIKMEDLPLVAGSLALEEVKPLKAIEQKAIANALAKVRGDKKAAAMMLGIGRTTLYMKLQKYGLKT